VHAAMRLEGAADEGDDVVDLVIEVGHFGARRL
jgi:hypothetical protein